MNEELHTRSRTTYNTSLETFIAFIYIFIRYIFFLYLSIYKHFIYINEEHKENEEKNWNIF